MIEHDPTDLEGQEARQAAKEAADAQEARWELEDLCWLMSTKRGRRVMWRLLSNAGVNRLSYQQSDALGTAFMEGNRNQGLRLTTLLLGHASKDYALMVQERNDAR